MDFSLLLLNQYPNWIFCGYVILGIDLNTVLNKMSDQIKQKDKILPVLSGVHQNPYIQIAPLIGDVATIHGLNVLSLLYH